MNTKVVNTAFISKLKSVINGSSIDILTDILPLSKEAIYRRLRGEVQFSYSEVVLIARKLNLSLDELVFGDNDHIRFNYLASQGSEPSEIYANTLKTSIDVFNLYENSKDTRLYMASTNIPLFFIAPYDHLFRFYYYEFIYSRTHSNTINKKYRDIEVPTQIKQDVTVYVDRFSSMDTTIMLSDNMFEYYMNTLKYFISVNLINKSEAELIKKDLYNMIDQMEAITTKGVLDNGSQMNVYLVEVSIDSFWGYIQNQTKEVAFARILPFGHAISHSPSVCRSYKESINCLKKYASLISQSGSTLRTEYFNKQRKLIKDNIN